MPFFAVPGARLYYECTGQGPAILFAHGLGGNHLSWWQQVSHFRDRFTCITFAHRGFAPSGCDGQPDPADFVDDLARLIDHLVLKDVRLIAQSMGGRSCLGWALREPERVPALVLAGTTATLAHPEVARLRQRSGASEALLAQGIHPAAGARMAGEQPALHFLYMEISALSAGLDRTTLREKLERGNVTPPEALAGLRMPVLCITGEEDAVLPPAAVAILASLIPNARLVRIPEAGHSVYFERAPIFNGLVDAFLAGTASRE